MELIIKKFKDLVWQEIQQENNWFKQTKQLVTVTYKDIDVQCVVEYNEIDIERISDIEIVYSDRENELTNIIEFLNRELW